MTNTTQPGSYLVAYDYSLLSAGATLDPGTTASLGTVDFNIAQGCTEA